MWARSGTGSLPYEIVVREVGTGGVESMLLLLLLMAAVTVLELLLSKISGRLLEMVLESGSRLMVERAWVVLTMLTVLLLLLLLLLAAAAFALVMSVGTVLEGWRGEVLNDGVMDGEGKGDSDKGLEDGGCSE